MNVLVTATDTATDTATVTAVSLALSAAASFSGGVAVSDSVSTNDIGDVVLASIDGAKVTATGNVMVTVSTTPTISTTATGIGVAVAVGAAAAGAVALAGAQTINAISTGATASIVNSLASDGRGVAAGWVGVSATDTATITSNAIAAAVTVSASIGGSGSVSLGSATALNNVTSTTTSAIDASTVTASAGSVAVETTESSTITATPVAAALSISVAPGSISAAASAAVGTNTIATDATARISGGSAVQARASVSVKATDTSSITATVVAVSFAAGLVGIAAGVSYTTNQITSTTSAHVTGSTVTASGGGITIEATSTQSPTATAVAVAVSVAPVGFSGSGASSTTNIASTTQAYAVGSTLTATGTVKVHAVSTLTATASGDGAAVGTAVGVAVMFADASVGGSTLAYVGGGATSVSAPALEVKSEGHHTVDSSVVAVGFGALGGAGGGAESTISRATEAFVGARAGTVASGTTSLTFTGTVDVDAVSISTATTSAEGGAIGAVSIAAFTADATVTQSTLAYVGERTTVTATTLDLTATATETATSDVTPIGAGAITGTGGSSSASASGAAEAFVGARHGAVPTPASTTTVSLTGAATLTATSTATATSDMFTLGVGIAAISVVFVDATVTAAARAYLGAGADVTATTLTASATSNRTADSSADVVGVGAVTGAGAESTASTGGAAAAFMAAGSEADLSGAASFTATTSVNNATTSLTGVSVTLVGGSVVLSEADAAGTTEAYVAGTLDATTLGLTATSTNTATPTSTTVAVAAGTFTVSTTEARISQTTDAGLRTGADVDLSGAATFTATSTSTPTAATTGVNVGIVAGAAQFVKSTLGGTTKVGSTSGTSLDAASLTATATSNNSSAGHVDASATFVGVSLLGGSGAVLSAGVTQTTQATIAGTTTLGGAASLTATSNTWATAENANVSVSGLSITVLDVTADLGGTTTAGVADGGTLTAGSLSATATGNATSSAETNFVGVSLAGGTGASTSATLVQATSALLGDNATVSLGTGAATLTATGTATSTATTAAVSVSGAQVNVMSISASTGGSVSASVGDSTTLTAGSLALSATGTQTPTATSSFVGVSGLSIGGSTVSASDATAVTARVGSEAGGAAATTVTTTGSGGVVATSTTLSQVSATADFVSVGILGDAAKVGTTATASPQAKSYVGDKASVATGSFDATFTAIARAAAKALGSGVSAGGLFAAGSASATATLSPTVSAFTSGTGSLTGRHVTFRSRLNTDAAGNPDLPPGFTEPASTGVTLGSGSLVAGVAGGTLTSQDNSVITTSVGGKTVNVSGNLVVESLVHQRAFADGFAIGVGLVAGVGVIDGTATVGGTTTTSLTGTVSNAAAVTVRSRVRSSSKSDVAGVAAALGGGGADVESTATTSPTVATTVSGNVTATGDVVVESDVHTSVEALASGSSVSGLVAVGIVKATAEAKPSVTTSVTGTTSITSSAGNVRVRAWHNTDNGTLLEINLVKAGVESLSASLLVSASKAEVTADASATVTTSTGAGTTLAAPAGSVTVEARSADVSLARAKTVGGALIQVSTNIDPAATTGGTTKAEALGHVRQGTSGSGALTYVVTAHGVDFASSVLDTGTGGAINISTGSASQATVDSTVEAILGQSGTVVVAGSAVTVQAKGISDGDATTRSGSGGAINVSGYGATVSTSPEVKVSVGGGVHITAPTVTIDATHNTNPPVYSNGLFSAVGDVTLADGITGNRITFSAVHGLSTGQSVTYRDLGGTTIGGLTDNRRYAVIVPSGPGVDATRSLQLGVVFSGYEVHPPPPPPGEPQLPSGDVDVETDEIRFDGRHGLVSGDMVYYFAPTGSTAVGGLIHGKLYRVVVIDDFTIKLADPLVVRDTEQVNASSVGVDADGGYVDAAHNFQLNDPVTYRAFATHSFNTQVVELEMESADKPKVTNNSLTYVNDNTIFLGTNPNQDGEFQNGHSFNTGDRVYYQVTGGAPLGGLANNTFYWVRRVDGFRIQLATTKCGATGADADCPGSGDQPPSVIDISGDRSAAGVKAVHKLYRENDAPLSGLTDGAVYFAIPDGANRFRLAGSPNGPALFFGNGGRTGGPHRFRVEGVNITSAGTGIQHLVLDLSSLGTGTHQLEGVGGSGVLAGAPSGDQTATASSSGSSGGAIDIANANATSTADTTVSNTIGGSAVITATTINVTVDNRALAGANTTNSGGGLVSVGDANATATANTTTTLTISSGAQLTARTINVTAAATHDATAASAGGVGGLGAGVDTTATVNLKHTTKTIVNGTLTALDTIDVAAATSLDAEAEAESDGGGLGVDSEATAKIHVHADSLTWTEIGGTARLTAEHVNLDARVPHVYLRADADSDADAFAADSDAEAEINVRGDARVLLRPRTGSTTAMQLTGNQTITIEAVYGDDDGDADDKDFDVESRSDASCDCAFGDADSRSDLSVTTQARVSGENESQLKTASLFVAAHQFIDNLARPRDAHGGAFVDHSEPSDFNTDPVRRIYWESTVYFLGEANPLLVVDKDGRITSKTNTVYVRGYDPGTDTYTALLEIGDTIPTGQWIVVGDLIYDQSGYARFEADRIEVAGDDDDPQSVIYGNAGEFYVQDTWDSVTILNYSNRKLVTNDIDVTSSANDPLIEILVEVLPDPANPTGHASIAETIDPYSAGSTFEFDLIHAVPMTGVQIRNLHPAGLTQGRSDVVLDGFIENPIGTTIIENVRGDVLSDNALDLDGIESTGVDANFVAIFAIPGNDTDVELIRTNVLEIDASTGNVGRQGGPRVPVAAELIRFDYLDGALHDLEIRVKAAGDVVLDLTAVRRDDTPFGDPFEVQIDTIAAGQDVDVVLHDSVEGNQLGVVLDTDVSVYPGPTYDVADRELDFEEGDDDLRVPPSDTYVQHFWPDPDPAAQQPPTLIHVLRAFGTDRNVVDSHYVFGDNGTAYGDLRAGDDIHVRHDETNSVIDITAFTDVASTLLPYTPLTEAADDGLPSDVTQIFLRTNGFIVDNELYDDLRAGHVHSTGDDVTLFSPRRIVDADGRPTIDVTGVNITMVAGSLVDADGVTLPDANRGLVGGIGLAADFLETDVDVLNGSTGAVIALDVQAPTTTGVYLDELVGDLRVDLVQTRADVSLRTVGGSILDREQDSDAGETEADVIGQEIDLDANGTGADIGDTAGSNDLDIDSSCAVSPTCGTGDVALEATDGIYLTETDSTLRLALAHTYDGDIRLTVRETTPDLDEDLVLLGCTAVAKCFATFAESNIRAPGLDPDAPREIARATIFAERGAVVLRVGDDVDLHQNSEILAAESIDVYADAASAALNPLTDLDEHFGAALVLRGRIIADCVLTTGDPMGWCQPSTVNPLAGRTTNIWGHTDADTFQFGDPSGDPALAGGGLETHGANGYVFIGSKTDVHGSQDLDSGGDDGEDTFAVYFLQTADVKGSPAHPAGAGHALTLDGQADTDFYEIWTTGSQGPDRNYVVNVLDTGASDDGVDELAMYGRDSDLDGNDPSALPTVTKYPTDDIFLLRRVTCIDTESPYALDAAYACTSPTAPDADRPGFVALLHGPLEEHRFDGPSDVDAPNAYVQRVNYDTALNGRLSVYGRGGNDAFFSDDTSVIVTLDGGAGFDTFQIGQIFGTRRDNPVGVLMPNDTFPELIPTTRGWLSPGISAPMVVQGGTGNDEFTVYSNQAELRLEGDDDNDLFVVRAFAIAAVCDTDADGDGVCGLSDVSLEPDLVTGRFPVDSNDDGVCNSADSDDFTGFRLDNNDDEVCNNADADLAAKPWQAEIIPLDADGVAVPVIGSGFSTDRPLDIRTGGGEDEVQYNVNAPVSVDGGTGIDKLIVLGTEFADDIVITKDGIFGAGLNVRYAALEIVEVDGLEGDDEFFVQSTAFGVAYRVIGGLGSDTINVTGDITEDIVTRELEGISGAVDHWVTSTDPGYDGLPTDGIETNVAVPEAGAVIVEETGSGTTVRENDPPVTFGGSSPTADVYSVRISTSAAADLVGNVYITVSAARSPQEEADDQLVNPFPLTDGEGDTVVAVHGHHERRHPVRRPGRLPPPRLDRRRARAGRPAGRGAHVHARELHAAPVRVRLRGRRPPLRGRPGGRGPAQRDRTRRPRARRVPRPQRRGGVAGQRHAGHLRHRDHPRLVPPSLGLRGGPAHHRHRARHVQRQLHRARRRDPGGAGQGDPGRGDRGGRDRARRRQRPGRAPVVHRSASPRRPQPVLDRRRHRPGRLRLHQLERPGAGEGHGG